MDTLLKILAEYGFAGFVLVVVTTLVFKVVTSQYKGSLARLAASLSAAPTQTTDPRYHPFFTQAHHKIVAEIPTLELSPATPVKQQMFRDILIIYTKTMVEVCHEIVNQDMEDWPGEKWANEVGKYMNRMLTQFHKNARDANIPEAALMKFNKWHYPSLEMMYGYITTLGTSNLYSNNLIRTNTFLLIANLMLVTTLGDAERSLKELNGEIGGLMYKNAILEH